MDKHNSQMADANDNPLIGPAQDALADVSTAGAESANLIARVNDILDVLRAHGLIKTA